MATIELLRYKNPFLISENDVKASNIGLSFLRRDSFSYKESSLSAFYRFFFLNNFITHHHNI